MNIAECTNGRGHLRSGHATALLALTAACLLALAAPPAQAAPPAHPFLADLSLDGSNAPAGDLDHACGAAVDTEGDVYVASAGNNAVEVFDAGGDHLVTIANSNSPCGLAVDLDGKLYVSESATGNVVRYTPDAFPLTATPTYGPPTTIDSSGDARGVAVDPVEGRLYVARGDHLFTYQPDGSPGIDEVQEVRVSVSAVGGTFTLAIEGEETAPIAFDASHAQVQTALEALATVGTGNVVVSEGPELGNPRDHRIAFVGALGAADVEALLADGSGLIGSQEIIVRDMVRSFDGRIGDGQLSDATGVAVHTYGGGVIKDRYVFAADATTDEVAVFTGTDIGSLAARAPIDGTETPDGDIGFGAAGAQLAVDPANGHLLAYDDDHRTVDEFEASGEYVTQIEHPFLTDAEPTGIAVHPAWSEAQRVDVKSEGGTFTLSFEGEETAPLTHGDVTGSANSAEVQSALEALPTIGAGNVVVARNADSVERHKYNVTFVGAFANRDVEQLVADGSNLVDPFSPIAAVSTLRNGSARQALPADPGAVYVTAGAGAGSEALAFGPLTPPSHPALPQPFIDFGAAGYTQVGSPSVDSHGNIYIAGTIAGIRRIGVYDPQGNPILSFNVSGAHSWLEVDSHGNIYSGRVSSGVESLVAYQPDSFPPAPATAFGAAVTIETLPFVGALKDLALNADDHLFAAKDGAITEYSNPIEGTVERTLTVGNNLRSIDVCGRSGALYVIEREAGAVKVIDPPSAALLARIDGFGSPGGLFPSEGFEGSVTVDNSNCHVVVRRPTPPLDEQQPALEEFETSGAFIAQVPAADVVDSGASSPNRGNFYYIRDKKLFTLGPLGYGAAPTAVTGIASGVGGGDAILNGTVNPHGFPVEECRFEYLSEAQYVADGESFAGAASADCAGSLATIGAGNSPVAVHADLAGLDPDARYRYRLLTANEFGSTADDPGLFGPPLLVAKPANPVLYTEATLRGVADPSGLPTAYRFEYGDSGPCSASACTSTPVVQMSAGAAATEVEVPLLGLAQGATYHFRLVVENEAATLTGPDQLFTTLTRPSAQDCPNAALRIGLSRNLPDCRAYELVTPADSGSVGLGALASGLSLSMFNSRMITPAGDSVVFSGGTLPGIEGVSGGDSDYRARRDGLNGWSTHVFSPSAAQVGELGRGSFGISPDHEFSFQTVSALSDDPGSPGSLPERAYLRTPGGFEPLAQGSLGDDLTTGAGGANGRFISPGAVHVIFDSSVRLEPAAPPAPARAIYDRAPGGPLQVVSLLPGEVTPTSSASFVGASADGSSVAFKVDGTLYVRQDNAETVEVATGPSTFAGLSDDGERLFYSDAEGTAGTVAQGTLAVLDLDSRGVTEIAPDSRFFDLAADGSRAYLTSSEVLDTGAEETPGGRNLYIWDGSGIHFIATLDSLDYHGIGWPGCIAPHTVITAGGGGRNECPSRTTPNGGMLLFESRVALTAYDSEGRPQVYRYDAAEDSLLCVSCDPTGAPPTAGASLGSDGAQGGGANTIVPNVTADGASVFFESGDPLLPDDANTVIDVYAWKAQSTGNCARPGGCLALISTGQGEQDSRLYAMTADGSDVLFSTRERILPSDVIGSHSIYDARVGGGIPDPPLPAPCQGDACQGQGSPRPVLPAAGSAAFSGAGNLRSPAAKPKKRRCAGGKRKVRRAGKVRCVKRKNQSKRKKRPAKRANHSRRAAR